jgi:hypothetical protein
VILYYALGGGLGHLARARKVLDALGIEEATLLSASEHARDRRVVGDLPVLHVPPALGRDRRAFRAWLQPRLAVEELSVDSFPGGILGELCGLPLPPARHVARRLRWERYAKRLDGPLPWFEAVHVLEPLSRAHAHELEWYPRVEPLALPESPAGEPLCDDPHTLVVHSGPDAEIAALLERSGPGRTIVVSPRRPALDVEWRDVYPVAPHLAGARHVITAAGFNLMHETARMRERHTCVPFPRALDDQFARA